MARYVGKRILLMIPVLLGIAFIIFSIMEFTPGDPAKLILGENATEEAVAQLHQEMGLDDPFLVRFVRYVADAVQGDLGESYRTGLSVQEEIMSRLPVTMKLAMVSILLAIGIGVPIGIYSAVRQYSLGDNLFRMLAMTLNAVPGFWLGLMLMMKFALELSWFPATGVTSWKSYVLPSIALCTGTAASLVRMTRSAMLDVVRQDYIRTARAKGAGEMLVIMGHALQNALLPVVTAIGMSFGSLMGGAIVTESVFALPGLGTLMINSIRMKDVPLVLASVLYVAVITGVVSLLVDILYAYIDPRIKVQYERQR